MANKFSSSPALVNFSQLGWRRSLTSVCALLFFLLSLIVPSGYSYAPFILLLLSASLLLKQTPYNPSIITKHHWLIIYGFLVIGAVGVLDILLHDNSTRELDKPLRFIVAAPIFIYLIQFPPKVSFIWMGAIFGAISTGIFAVVLKLTTNAPRIDGFGNAIQFGNIAMLLGLISLASIAWAYTQKRKKLIVILALLGFLGGLIASLLSGSRGGWIGAPLVILYILYQFRSLIPKSLIISIFTLLALVVTLAAFMPNIGAKERIYKIQDDLELYQQDNAATSIGTRLELWKASVLIFIEHPIVGAGSSGFDNQLNELIAQRDINAAIISRAHSHNEILFAVAKLGIVGASSLVFLFFSAIAFFKHALAQDKVTINHPVAVAGLIVVLCYIDFGLTQVSFSHNSGVMFYSIALSIFASATFKSRPPSKATLPT